MVQHRHTTNQCRSGMAAGVRRLEGSVLTLRLAEINVKLTALTSSSGSSYARLPVQPLGWRKNLHEILCSRSRHG